MSQQKLLFACSIINPESSRSSSRYGRYGVSWQHKNMNRIFDVVSERRKIARDDLIMAFEGTQLLKSTTPVSVGMQDDSIITSYVKQDFEALEAAKNEKIHKIMHLGSEQDEIEETTQAFSIKVRLSASEDIQVRVSKVPSLTPDRCH